MVKVEFDVQGIPELQQALLGLSQRVAKNVLRRAVAAGAKVMRDEAKLKAPIYSGILASSGQPPGTLKRSIIMKHIPELSGTFDQIYYVTVRQGKQYRGQGKNKNLSQDAYYAKWVEHGHWYVPPNTTGKNWKSHREKYRTGAEKQWVSAHPFMRPAFDTKQVEVKRLITERITSGVVAEFNK